MNKNKIIFKELKKMSESQYFKIKLVNININKEDSYVSILYQQSFPDLFSDLLSSHIFLALRKNLNSNK